jgi:ABC-type bacteriocin/lantibiotic exporter with double-glycine peptidase domain
MAVQLNPDQHQNFVAAPMPNKPCHELDRVSLRFIPQRGLGECGIACIAMVAAFYEIPFTLDLARLSWCGGVPTSLYMLAELAALNSLDAVPLRGDMTCLTTSSLPIILHKKPGHYIVLANIDGSSKGGEGAAFEIYDPASGIMVFSRGALATRWSGYALHCVPKRD